MLYYPQLQRGDKTMIRLFVNNANMMQLGIVMQSDCNQAYIVIPLSKL